MDAVSATTTALLQTATVVLRNLSAHSSSIAWPLFVIVVLHLVIEYGLPALFPAVWSSLQAFKPGVTTRAEAAASARTKIISGGFAIYVTALSSYALMDPNLSYGLHAVTPLSLHLIHAACAYFLHDLLVLATDVVVHHCRQ